MWQLYLESVASKHTQLPCHQAASIPSEIPGNTTQIILIITCSGRRWSRSDPSIVWLICGRCATYKFQQTDGWNRSPLICQIWHGSTDITLRCLMHLLCGVIQEVIDSVSAHDSLADQDHDEASQYICHLNTACNQVCGFIFMTYRALATIRYSRTTIIITIMENIDTYNWHTKSVDQSMWNIIVATIEVALHQVLVAIKHYYVRIYIWHTLLPYHTPSRIKMPHWWWPYNIWRNRTPTHVLNQRTCCCSLLPSKLPRWLLQCIDRLTRNVQFALTFSPGSDKRVRQRRETNLSTNPHQLP